MQGTVCLHVSLVQAVSDEMDARLGRE